MGKMTTEKHEKRQLLLGDNEFRSGVLKVAANSTVKCGDIVQTKSGKFEASEGDADETGLGVFVGEDVENSTTAAVETAVRVCISGKIDSELLTIGGTKATEAQADVLRGFGFVPLKVTQYSQFDNE